MGEAPGDAMTLVVDGRPLEVASGLTVEGLLSLLGEPARHVLVEVNRVYIPPARHAAHVLQEGDVVEIILPAFGG